MGSKVSYIIQLKDKFGRVAANVNRQFVKIQRNADKAKKSIRSFVKKSQVSLGDLGRKAARTGAIMTAALTVPIALMGKKMIDAASDAKEVSDKFDAVFSGIRGKARSAAKEFATTFSLANSTAQEMLGSTGDLLVGFGFTDDKALGLSKTISKMALDLAAFQNLEGGAPRASKALTSALSGETEGLKSLGIVVNQNDPMFKSMLKQNLRITRGNIVQAKSLTILKIAQNQTTKANNNYLDTLHTYAGLQRVNTEANKKLNESFGKIMLPLAIRLTRVLTKLVTWIGNLSKPMKTLVLVLAGLVAIGGPLLLVLGGIAIALSVISLPMLVIGGAIAALIVAGVMLAANWDGVVGGAKALWGDFVSFMSSTADKISSFFSGLWDGLVSGLRSFVNFGISHINNLLAPLNFVAEKLGLGSVQIKTIQAPSAPSQSAGGTLNGNITVSAAQGSSVESTSMATKGSGLNVGMNMATQ